MDLQRKQGEQEYRYHECEGSPDGGGSTYAIITDIGDAIGIIETLERGPSVDSKTEAQNNR